MKDWTPRSAWKELTERPLVFGDARQISAHKFLLSLLAEEEEELGYAVEFSPKAFDDLGDCENCGGSGYCECPECGAEHDCKECEGTGWGMPEMVRAA